MSPASVHTPNGSGSAHDSPPPSPTDSMSSIDTIASHEIPTYYEEFHGRRFYAQVRGHSPYVLPADPTEMERLNLQHETIKLLISGNHLGPVGDVLAPDQGGRQKVVMDLGTGSGIWVEQMAHAFPHVKFIGVDLVPTATRYPPEHVRFECYNIVRNNIRHPNASVDFVHARFLSLGISDYPGLLNEVARVLRPGGLFFSGEWDLTHKTPSGAALSTSWRTVAEAERKFLRAVQTRGLEDIAARIPGWVRQSGRFVGITPHVFDVPIGASADWPNPQDERSREVAEMGRAYILGFADAVKPLFLSTAGPEEDVEDFMRAYKEELDRCSLIGTYRVVYATRSQLQ